MDDEGDVLNPVREAYERSLRRRPAEFRVQHAIIILGSLRDALERVDAAKIWEFQQAAINVLAQAAEIRARKDPPSKEVRVPGNAELPKRKESTMMLKALQRCGINYTMAEDLQDPSLKVLTIENVKTVEDMQIDVLLIFDARTGDLMNVEVREDRR